MNPPSPLFSILLLWQLDLVAALAARSCCCSGNSISASELPQQFGARGHLGHLVPRAKRGEGGIHPNFHHLSNGETLHVVLFVSKLIFQPADRPLIYWSTDLLLIDCQSEYPLVLFGSIQCWFVFIFHFFQFHSKLKWINGMIKL